MKTLPALLIALIVAVTGWIPPLPSAAAATPASAAAAPGLHQAALAGDADAVRRLLAQGADLNAKDAYGSTPLVIAATFGQVAVAKALIAAGADLAIANPDGSTPLKIAAFFGRTEIVQALLDAGANRYVPDYAGDTALASVSAPFDRVKPILEGIGQALGPLGLTLDLARIEANRPKIAAMLHPSIGELEAVRYAPVPGADWETSTPEAQGVDPMRLAQTYLEASGLRTLYALLVVKDGKLIAEKYFNEGGIDQLSGRQSMTKSVTSAMVGLALARGCVTSLDQKMLDFFPELAARITDLRKRRITVRQLLQMRAGFPWEALEPPYFERLYLRGDWHWLPHLADFPLTSDPGTTFRYSNLTSHALAVIAARACKTDLQGLAQDHLLGPIGAKVERWTSDPDGYRWGWGEIYLTARDMAKFGQLYLDEGRYGERQVLPAAWVRDSLQRYSEGINFSGPAGASEAGKVLRDLGYGYQWWSARAGSRRFDFAWGHGGQLVALLHDLHMVIVTAADPLHHLPGQEGWRHEGAIIDLVGRLVRALPAIGSTARR